jgi:hypothetical protein
MILFGSTIIKKNFDDFRSPNDRDWYTTDPDEVLPSNNTSDEYYFMGCMPNREPTMDEMLTLKMSHAIYDIKWQKTMSDVRFLQIKGMKVVPSLLKELRLFWEGVHGKQRRTDFEVEPGKFFEDRVRRKTEHDELHRLINPTPTYTKMITNGVTPDEELYQSLPENDRVELLFEEAFVIAIERFSKLPDMTAYNKAQQLLVTALHPEWLADEVIANWNKHYWTPGKSVFYNKYKQIKKEQTYD